MDNLEMICALRALTDEVRELRHEVLRLSEKTKMESLKGRWLNTKEAMAFTGKSRSWLQAQVGSTEIDFSTKVGRDRMYPADKLEEFMAKCKRC